MPKDFWARARDQDIESQISFAEARWLFEQRDKPRPGWANSIDFEGRDLRRQHIRNFDEVMRSFSEFRVPFEVSAVRLLGEERVRLLKQQPSEQRALLLVKLFGSTKGGMGELAAWALAGIMTPEIRSLILDQTDDLSAVSPWFLVVVSSHGIKMQTVKGLLEQRERHHQHRLQEIDDLTLQLQEIISGMGSLNSNE